MFVEVWVFSVLMMLVGIFLVTLFQLCVADFLWFGKFTVGEKCQPTLAFNSHI